MSPRQLALEDFGAPAPRPATRSAGLAPGLAELATLAEPGTGPAADAEAMKLEAFENGYRAGWEDATGAAASEQGHIAADLAQNLRDLSFTLAEAQAAVLAEMRPLLREIVAKLLPAAAHASLAGRIADELTALAERAADCPVELVLAPTHADALGARLEADSPLPLTVIAEPSLPEGQAYLRFGQRETAYDMGTLVESLRALAEGWLAETEPPAEPVAAPLSEVADAGAGPAAAGPGMQSFAAGGPVAARGGHGGAGLPADTTGPTHPAAATPAPPARNLEARDG
jgi:flagellar assembly protein FliH